MFINGFVVIMVGNVPQGLPTTITACLYLVAESMRKQNVFVKKLDIIETLGCCSCICTDKTGTLTLNLMTVYNYWVVDSKLTAASALQDASAGAYTPSTHGQFAQLLDIASLNSRVVLELSEETSELAPSGDATELGLYKFSSKMLQSIYQTDIEKYRAARPKVHEIPFNSSFKWQMSIHTLPNQQEEVMFLKGAPDVLMNKCGFYLDSAGSIKPIDAEFMARYTEVYEEFGGNGERVLGFAYKPCAEKFEILMNHSNGQHKDQLKAALIGKEPATAVKDMIFAGLFTLMDPPRPEVPQAVRDCHTAGVKVVMVTGDHPLTAAAIARNIGLITKPTRDILAKQRGVPKEIIADNEVEAVVIHGGEIAGMKDDDWARVVKKPEIVFARTSPEQKLIIVKEFTKAGNVTAMTGDGVNDSPALKQAAIGIAMGLNGSAVAKEAADVVLLDDNFASIVTGIKEGRLLFANLKKSIAYTLAHLTPEVIPVLFWGYGGTPQPMGALLTLCIDLITELVPATSFAFEKAESLIMQVSPRNIKTDRLTSFPLLFYAYGQAGIIITAACWFVYFRTFQHYGISPSDLFTNNNKFFPKNENHNFVTDDGRVYNGQEQLHILQSVQAGWYLMIVIGQAAHVWVCRTTTVSIFEHGFFSNQVTNIGAVLAICLGCFVVYCPGISYVVGTKNPFSLDLFYAALWVTAALWSYTEGRKWFTRTYPQHWLNKILAW
ncbi:HAD family hydrolase [archaeon]|nr:MAG: HAD family hydrolase [archaeon]